ncbi:lysis system i-spanin subunit Rz [Paraburkholderia terricola]|uniref:lysis system i-spanin subunit Rz n=1 Tax=Paraburkholderia terricola TaxID=169427 RepID=UPI003ED1555A
MNGYFITGIAAGVLGIAIGAGGMHYTVDAVELSHEQTAHANDNTRHTNDLNLISKAALDAENRAIETHTVAEGKIATMDEQLTKERIAHEADNKLNRDAIADGNRRLRIAVSNFHPASGDQTGGSPGAGSVGDGASGYAYLPSATGLALFSIVDDADGDARAKADYLQGYVRELEDSGYIVKQAGAD